LLGVLAVQNALISREDLVSAVAEWAEDTARSMGTVLLARGAIDDERLALLEALLGEHLGRHEDDPAQALAAVSTFGPLCADLNRLNAANLQAALSQIPTGTTVSGHADHSATELFDSARRSRPRLRSQERFHVLRSHKKGGLGEVFVARDVELNRDVALKQILDALADDQDSRARFLLEAEVTGGLEHPGVVPVYGLGSYDDGRPYYAMRFVKGDSLRDAVARFHRGEPPESDPGARRVALRQLLGRFVDVCDAVAYAHSRGVLHRDIKPGNILLGPYGETLVVDWGLAKVIGRAEIAAMADSTETTLRPPSAGSSDATRLGSLIGTPGYMSPEQAAGAMDQLGVATDVYSLGATLFFVLTGRAPFEGPKEAVLRDVRAGNFPRPRQIAPATPAGLEAICVKAMALQPQDRYPTARAVALDVEHWLADEPVSALPEGPAQRLARWFRRHRGFAASATAALALVTAVSVVATVVVSNALQAERAALARETRALQAERAAKAEAQLQRNTAESNFEVASQAVEQVFRVADLTLAAIPGREQDRRKMAEDALKSCVSLLKARPRDPGLRYLTARVERLVGNTNRLTGRFEQARVVHLSAVDRLSVLVKEFPDETRYGDRLAELEVEVSETLRMAGRAPRAVPHAQSGLEVAEALWAANANHPKSLEFRATKALCLGALAGAQLDSGEAAEAVRSYDAAIDLYEFLSKSGFPLRSTIPLELALAYTERGKALHEANRARAAEDSIDQSLAAVDKLLAANQLSKNNLEFIRSCAELVLASTLAPAPDRRNDAAHAFDEAVKGFSQLAEEFPWLADYRKSLVIALEGRAALRGSTREAEDDLGRARTLAERLVTESRDAPAYDGLLGRILGRLGLLARARGDRTEARRLLNDAITRQKKALDPKSNPDSPPDKAALQRHEEALKALNEPKSGGDGS
jgi:serine/threonine-protein kinase